MPKAGTETLMELLHILAQLNNYTAAHDDMELKAKRYQSYSNNLSSDQTPNHDFLFTENDFVYFQIGLFDENRYHTAYAPHVIMTLVR